MAKFSWSEFLSNNLLGLDKVFDFKLHKVSPYAEVTRPPFEPYRSAMDYWDADTDPMEEEDEDIRREYLAPLRAEAKPKKPKPLPKPPKRTIQTTSNVFLTASPERSVLQGSLGFAAPRKQTVQILPTELGRAVLPKPKKITPYATRRPIIDLPPQTSPKIPHIDDDRPAPFVREFPVQTYTPFGPMVTTKPTSTLAERIAQEERRRQPIPKPPPKEDPMITEEIPKPPPVPPPFNVRAQLTKKPIPQVTMLMSKKPPTPSSMLQAIQMQKEGLKPSTIKPPKVGTALPTPVDFMMSLGNLNLASLSPSDIKYLYDMGKSLGISHTDLQHALMLGAGLKPFTQKEPKVPKKRAPTIEQTIPKKRKPDIPKIPEYVPKKRAPTIEQTVPKKRKPDIQEYIPKKRAPTPFTPLPKLPEEDMPTMVPKRSLSQGKIPGSKKRKPKEIPIEVVRPQGAFSIRSDTKPGMYEPSGYPFVRTTRLAPKRQVKEKPLEVPWIRPQGAFSIKSGTKPGMYKITGTPFVTRTRLAPKVKPKSKTTEDVLDRVERLRQERYGKMTPRQIMEEDWARIERAQERAAGLKTQMSRKKSKYEPRSKKKRPAEVSTLRTISEEEDIPSAVPVRVPVKRAKTLKAVSAGIRKTGGKKSKKPSVRKPVKK